MTNPNANAVQPRRHSADSFTLEEQCHPRKLFIGGLAHKTTTQHLRDHFSKYGNIVDAVVLRWPDGRSRGFGYATFADVTSANAALKQTHQIGGRQVDTKRAVPGTNKLFVGGLPQNTTVAELREHFEKLGVVSDAVVMIDPVTSRSRGFGFICFLPGQEGAAAVAAALEQYDNHRIRGKWIEVKSASPPHKLVKEQKGESDKDEAPEVQPKIGNMPEQVEQCRVAPTTKGAPLKFGGRALVTPQKQRNDKSSVGNVGGGDAADTAANGGAAASASNAGIAAHANSGGIAPHVSNGGCGINGGGAANVSNIGVTALSGSVGDAANVNNVGGIVNIDGRRGSGEGTPNGSNAVLGEPWKVELPKPFANPHSFPWPAFGYQVAELNPPPLATRPPPAFRHNTQQQQQRARR